MVEAFLAGILFGVVEFVAGGGGEGEGEGGVGEGGDNVEGFTEIESCLGGSGARVEGAGV